MACCPSYNTSQNKLIPSDKKELEVNFSKREIEILQMVARGYTNEEIAEKYFLSKRTVETHRRNMLNKTNTRNTASLITYAINNGWIKE